jgi:hypothetical protein
MADKLTIHDLRAAGFCVTGIKDHYEKMGLDQDFRSFVRNGLDIESARLIDDAHVQRGIEKAEERIAAKKGAE